MWDTCYRGRWMTGGASSFIVVRMSTSTDWYQERRRNTIEACCQQLVAERVIEPLSTDVEKTRSWNLCESDPAGWSVACCSHRTEPWRPARLGFRYSTRAHRDVSLAGWPLIRSEEAWERRWHWSGAGEPEGLAYKIEIFEAVYRERGFDVRTPRIPGIQYRSLEEIDADDSLGLSLQEERSPQGGLRPASAVKRKKDAPD
jgi:hypothetical protein